MASLSDTNRPRRVKADFDPDFVATPHGGAVLAEQLMRATLLRRLAAKHLPARAPGAVYSTAEIVHAVVAGLLVGGRGLQATEVLRQDTDLAAIFGFEAGAPSDSTVYRALCNLSGLKERCEADWYVPSGPALPALDMLGNEARCPALRRVVPDMPERAVADKLEQLHHFLLRQAVGCLSRMPRKDLCVSDFLVVFGDGTDLEVEGNCFDAARTGRTGARLLRWMTLMVGPVFVAHELCEGNQDEGVALPGILRRGAQVVREVAGRNQQVLALLDAAFCERAVVEALDEQGWQFIICANQIRNKLRELAQEQPASVWSDGGADERRGWVESQVCAFTHLPEGWASPVTIVCRRWHETGDLPGVWHYSFLATRLTEHDLSRKLLKHGFCGAIWMLYGTKQGRENHYKTPLCDLGLHNPPSGRLGVNQALYTLALAATNMAMVLRYRVLPAKDRGMTLWRIRAMYFRIAGYLRRGARTLLVRLSGVICPERQALFRQALATAGRL